MAIPEKQPQYHDYFDDEADDDDDDDDDEVEYSPLSPAMVRAAEKSLGYRLPAAYVDLLNVRNGGYLKRSFFPTTQCPQWADDHVAFDQVMGIGAEGIDDEYGSQYLIAEWDYPNVGVVISSDGHTAFMLDYSLCGNDGEPRVVWIDVETGDDQPYVAVLAPDFASFLAHLRFPPDDE